MKGELIRVSPSTGYTTFLLRMQDGGYGLTYTGEQFRNFPAWSQLRVGDFVDGLEWKNKERHIIDADSPVHTI